MYIPKKVYPKLMQKLLKGVSSYKTIYGEYWGSCTTSDYSSLYLLMNGYWFEIPPSVYVESIPGYSDCFIQFSRNSDNTWLLGDTFLRNFYSVWDNDNN
jgi:Eukaryotic aspartyl protease